MSMNVIAHPSAGRVQRVRAGGDPPTFDHEWDTAVRNLMQTASEAGYQDGEKIGYIHGARAGRVAGACWGVLLGAVSAAAYLTLWSAP